MKKFGIIFGVLAVLFIVGLIIVGVLGLSASGSYNHLVALNQEVDSQWAQVENNYQRRADLIPNLVSTVSGAAKLKSIRTKPPATRPRCSNSTRRKGNSPPRSRI